MTSVNLTHEEAKARKALLEVEHYDIRLDLTTGDTTFDSTTTVRFRALEAGSTFIDLIAQSVRSVSLDGVDITSKALSFKAADAGSAADAGDSASVYDATPGIALELTPGEHTLVVDAECKYSHTGQGLHRFVDPVDNEVYCYTQFQTADAKRVFACFDQPDLKARYRLAVTAPKHWTVILNQSTDLNALSAEEATVTTCEVDYPLSTYLVAICAGPYVGVRDTWKGHLTHYPETPATEPAESQELEIPLGIYCRKSLAKHLDHELLFKETKEGFDYYHKRFGIAYPFSKYDQIFVPEFNAGAMENAGAVTFRDEYVFSSKVTQNLYQRRCDTIMHEMAHMWFGDLVTMAWWDDLWLNESFATWASAICRAQGTEEHKNAWETFASVEKSWAYQQDQLPTTHPISTDASDIQTVEQNFDGITYAKGASVLKQLQAFVGEEAFFTGVRKHFAAHAFSNATFDDLLQALQEASGKDLSNWANQWLKTTGINTLAADFSIQDGKYERFAITQTGAEPGAGEFRDHRIAIGCYSLIDGKLRRTHHVEVDISGERTDVNALVGLEATDVVLVNDDDLTYCLPSLDERSLECVVNHIGDFENPMARILSWSAAWEMTRNGKMKARDFLSLVSQGIASETHNAVLERILLQATQALRNDADPQWAREHGAPMLTKALFDAAAQSPAGSDNQLSFIQALAKLPLDQQGREEFIKIVDGDSTIGLNVDQGLQWWALTALIADGHYSAEEVPQVIDKMLEKDNTSAGKMAALRAAAAENRPEVKQGIINELIQIPNPLSNLELRHKVEGLKFQVFDPALEGCTHVVFEHGAAIWEGNSSEVALQTILGLYPSWDISKSAYDLAGAYLECELPAGLRRVIAEGRGRVETALRNREVDAC